MATGKGTSVLRGQITSNATTPLVPAPDATMGGTRIYIYSLRFMVKTAGTAWRVVVVDGSVEAAGGVVGRFAAVTADTEYTLYGNFSDPTFKGIPLTPGNALSAITSGTAGVVDYEVVYDVR